MIHGSIYDQSLPSMIYLHYIYLYLCSGPAFQMQRYHPLSCLLSLTGSLIKVLKISKVWDRYGSLRVARFGLWRGSGPVDTGLMASGCSKRQPKDRPQRASVFDVFGSSMMGTQEKRQFIYGPMIKIFKFGVSVCLSPYSLIPNNATCNFPINLLTVSYHFHNAMTDLSEGQP